MKTQLPEKLECHAGINCFHIKSPDSYILKTIDDRESSQCVCEAIVHRYNEHSQLVKDRDELVQALKNAQLLIIEHHSHEVMSSKHIICPKCSTKEGDSVLNQIAAILTKLKEGE